MEKEVGRVAKKGRERDGPPGETRKQNHINFTPIFSDDMVLIQFAAGPFSSGSSCGVLPS